MVVNGGVGQLEALLSPLEGLGALLIGGADVAGIQDHPLVEFLGIDRAVAVRVHLLHELLLRVVVPSVIAKVGLEQVQLGKVDDTVSVPENFVCNEWGYINITALALGLSDSIQHMRRSDRAQIASIPQQKRHDNKQARRKLLHVAMHSHGCTHPSTSSKMCCTSIRDMPASRSAVWRT